MTLPALVSRTCPGSNGSIMPCCSAMRLIHLSDFMDIPRPLSVNRLAYCLDSGLDQAGDRSARLTSMHCNFWKPASKALGLERELGSDLARDFPIRLRDR